MPKPGVGFEGNGPVVPGRGFEPQGDLPGPKVGFEGKGPAPGAGFEPQGD